tara:strand:- start:33 stop:686 length:654 start_codon:yes stop_codon:yes gene_type:complete
MKIPTEHSIDIFGSWMEVGMILAVVLAGAVSVFLPYMKKMKRKKCRDLCYPDNFNWDVHSRMHETLTELRVRTDCARAQIVQFHNGGYFLDGISMKKQSLTHESLAPGCSSERETKKDLLLSLCIEGLQLLRENESKLHIVEQLEDSWCKNFMQTANTISFAFLPLRKQSEVIGYIMVQWCSWSKTDGVDEEIVAKELETARNEVEVHLSRQHKRHK